MVVRLAQGFNRYSLLKMIEGLAKLPKCSFPFPFKSLKLARLVLYTIN
jgi:hypothetical protein